MIDVLEETVTRELRELKAKVDIHIPVVRDNALLIIPLPWYNTLDGSDLSVSNSRKGRAALVESLLKTRYNGLFGKYIRHKYDDSSFRFEQQRGFNPQGQYHFEVEVWYYVPATSDLISI